MFIGDSVKVLMSPALARTLGFGSCSNAGCPALKLRPRTLCRVTVLVISAESRCIGVF